jgi:hypothetical protein
MRSKLVRWIILGSYIFLSSLHAEAFVSANFLLFGPSVDAVTVDRLETLSKLKTDHNKQAVTTIYIPIFDDDKGQYARTREMLNQFAFDVMTTTPMSSDKDITSLDEEIGAAGVQFLKERVLITKELGGKVLTGALLFPELKGPSGKPIRPLDHNGKQIDPPVLTRLVNQRLRSAVPRMQEVADFAATYGITVANEYINHWEICGGNTMSSAIAFALEVNRPNFGILSDISHEVLQGKGPLIYAGELQFAKNSGLPIYLQISEPGRGDIVNSWIPFDQLFGIVQALNIVDKDHPLDIEIFDALGLNPTLMQLTRDPFVDPMQVLIDGVHYTHQRYESVPESFKRIPSSALSEASDRIGEERKFVYCNSL